nr:alpha/beta fold hydrolase [Verticiella sp. GG226]
MLSPASQLCRTREAGPWARPLDWALLIPIRTETPHGFPPPVSSRAACAHGLGVRACAGGWLGAGICASSSPAAPAAVTRGVPTAAAAQSDVQRLHAVAPDGTRLAVQVRGPAEAPAIVFVHGIAQSQLAFGRQVSSELAQRYRLVTYDLRGHGESDKPTAEGAYASGRVMSDDLQAVIKAAGVKRPVLVGWSLGGIVVAQYLRDYGEDGIAGVNFVGARVARPDGARPACRARRTCARCSPRIYS